MTGPVRPDIVALADDAYANGTSLRHELEQWAAMTPGATITCPHGYAWTDSCPGCDDDAEQAALADERQGELHEGDSQVHAALADFDRQWHTEKAEKKQRQPERTYTEGEVFQRTLDAMDMGFAIAKRVYAEYMINVSGPLCTDFSAEMLTRTGQEWLAEAKEEIAAVEARIEERKRNA